MKSRRRAAAAEEEEQVIVVVVKDVMMAKGKGHERCERMEKVCQSMSVPIDVQLGRPNRPMTLSTRPMILF
jgi:hypothetical protein